MPTWLLVMMIILAVLIVGVIVLYFVGKRMEKKQAAQQEQIQAAKQTVSMLIIDKKRMPLVTSGLPQAVIDQTPKLLRRNKIPVVKAKVGPRIMTLVADENIYDNIPLKREVKADVSGIYIIGVRGAHGKIDVPQQKKGFIARLRARVAAGR